MRILLIEDDAQTAAFVCNGLRESSHAVDHAATGRDGLAMAMAGGYDVIVLDRMLPDPDGLAIVCMLRGAGDPTPVLMLTALGDVDHRVEGLRAGADDYLVKPFAFAARQNHRNGVSCDIAHRIHGITPFSVPQPSSTIVGLHPHILSM